ncbi:hypothetical protein HNR60_000347 [Rhodopseudomonas rhenobacensis]|uniref:Uncharacterized protein n=1 Tax=Rhodopseudomonas rhenobacensis TaxID=87461 RepID=A0A7W8DX88_9BRAD|nr:hypothetical protein [Rhodopseudomonas rhenobacensis]MBB5045618.1 hypothetical protein [Rhodopseudomonas rhenobacensis]
MRSEAKTYQFDQLPVVDYDKHPAYGRVLPMAQLGSRLKAVTYFAYGLILAVARRLIDAENLPRPPAGEPKLGWILRHLPVYLRLIILQRLSRLAAGKAYQPKTERGANILAPLERDGVAGVRIAPDKLLEIRTELAPHITILEQRLALKPAIAADAEEARLWLDPETNGEIYKSFNQTAADLGVLEAASAYLKRPVGVGHLAVQINDPVEGASEFADVGVDSSATKHFHIDTSGNLLKLVIYLGDTGPANGPLSYVPGSQRAAKGLWDGLVRRANDFAGLSSTAPSARELFFALPEGWRRKASFGADLVAENDYARSILDDQWRVTSDEESAVLYDPTGIHRDGIVSAGRRTAVVLKLTELAR